MSQTKKVKFQYNPRVYRKTAGIFGKVTDTKIEIKFTEKGSCKVVQSPTNKNKFTIFLNPFKGYVRGLEQIFYTCEEHEIAHILFQSDAIAKDRFGKVMADKYEEFGIRRGQAKLVADVLDDQRIETCWSELFVGSEHWFDELRVNLQRGDAKSLGTMVLAARCKKKENIHPFFHSFYDYCVEQLKLVEKKSFIAIFPLSKNIVEAYIDIIKDFLENQKEQDQQQQSGGMPIPIPIPTPPQDQDDQDQEGSGSDSEESEGEMDESDESEGEQDSEESEENGDSDSSQDGSDSDDTESEETEDDSDSDENEEEFEDFDGSMTNETDHDDDFEEESDVESLFKEDDDSDDEGEGSGTDTEEDDSEIDEIGDLDSIFEPMEEETENQDVSNEEISREVTDRYLDNPASYEEESKLDFDSQIDLQQVLETALEDILEQAFEEFKDDLQVIEEKLSQFKPPDPTRNTGLPIDTNFGFGRDNSVDPYPELNDLKKIFRRINISDRRREELSYAGELDIDQYIQFIQGNADPDVFLDEKDEQELFCVLVIDGSSSMAHSGKMEKAKRVALTMKKASEAVTGVIVDVWIFSGSNSDSPVRELTEGELKTIGADGWTHTNDAVRFVTQQPKYRYKKCIMFLVTDGLPYSCNDKYSKVVKEEEGNKLTFVQADTHFAIQECRQRGWKVFTFFIGDPEGNSGIFGNPFVIMKGDRLKEVLGYFEREVRMFIGR